MSDFVKNGWKDAVSEALMAMSIDDKGRFAWNAEQLKAISDITFYMNELGWKPVRDLEVPVE